MIVKQLVAIQVEVLYHLLKIRRFQLPIAILALKLGQSYGIDVACVVSVDPLEGSVRLEIAHGGQDLAQSLDCNLLFSVVHQHFFHFKL